ncbi:ATP-dependent RNA helicase DHX58-like [Amphiura filiformis]|uniref:ATP-dependent RNA helicase DHX58-like n=1 Tax=Amphiura filiformis TaxID=82378 RepID=UPI003B2262F7
MAMASTEASADSPELKKRKISNPPPQIQHDDLKKVDGKIHKLGQGGFGTVYHRKWKGQDVAIKRFNPDQDDQKEYETELGVLCGLSHPNIVKLIGVVARSSEDEAFTLILELCNGGSLKSYLRKSTEKLPPDQFTAWATQAAQAIEYLHKQGIIHKDVKSDNYLIADENVLKLADFGTSKYADRTMDNATKSGTPAYMPPEIHSDDLLSPKFDFFSYGVVLWEILTRGTPYEGMEPQFITYNVTQKNLRPTIPSDCPEDLEKLMKRCWEEDRYKRPTIDEILSVVRRPRDTLADRERSKEDSLELTPKEDLSLHKYQLELAKPALPGSDGGKNIIIVAPTGCGKTIVAVKVVKEFLENANDGLEEAASSSAIREKPRKVVFLVDKVILVDQQCKVFRRFLDSKSIIGVSGETPHRPVNHILQEKSVIVMTAGILINALEEEIVKLSEIGLLILDECHNCQGGSPYNNIMAIYRSMKLSGEHPRPQILGMTASLSLGQAGTDSQAEENTLLLCANLDAEVISTVHSPECLEELAEHQNIPDEVIEEAPGRTQDPFAAEIKIIMGKIEGMMQNTPDWNALVKDNPELQIRNSRGNNAYVKWLRDTENDVTMIITNDKVRRKLLTCAKHLEKYNESLDINRNIRSKDALAHLEKFRQELESKRQGFDDTDKYLVQLFDGKKNRLQEISNDPANRNPILMKLGAVLKKAFTPMVGTVERRGILFAKTRAFTVALKTWIEDTDDLKFLRPGFLTGTGKVGVSDIRMTQSQQIDLLSRFREGNHKLIVATSIAQEGLDVASCNVVVRYNHTTNIVGRIQTKGRNRAKDSVYYLVVDEGLKLWDKEMMNRIGEKIMMNATKKVQKQLNENQQVMRDKIIHLQKADHRDREVQRRNEASKQEQRVKERVTFSCLKCNAFACYSDDIRCIKGQHRVVVDESFTSRFETKEHARFASPKTLSGGITMKKNIICRQCSSDWGTLATYEDEELPLIHPKNFRLVDANGNPKKLRKWKFAWFKIDDYDLCKSKSYD